MLYSYASQIYVITKFDDQCCEANCTVIMFYYELTEMEMSQMVEEMGRRMQEYQARIEELEKVAEVEVQRTAECALYGVKRRHDGSPVHQGGSATDVGDGANRVETRAEDNTQKLTPGTDRQVIVPIIEKVPIKLREKIWELVWPGQWGKVPKVQYTVCVPRNANPRL